MTDHEKKQLIAYLLTRVTDRKSERMASVLSNRTRHVTIALEDLYQQHNAAAALRSAECFGVQDVHIIEDQYRFKPAVSIALGSPKWLDVYRYDGVKQCIDTLKKNNYQIIATTPHTNASTIHDMPLDQKVALFFGTEETGVSSYVMDHADGYTVIPMYGFTESFNVSVSVALTLQALVTRLHDGPDIWQLSEAERDDVMLSWLRKTIRGADIFERRFLESIRPV